MAGQDGDGVDRGAADLWIDILHASAEHWQGVAGPEVGEGAASFGPHLGGGVVQRPLDGGEGVVALGETQELDEQVAHSVWVCAAGVALDEIGHCLLSIEEDGIERFVYLVRIVIAQASEQIRVTWPHVGSRGSVWGKVGFGRGGFCGGRGDGARGEGGAHRGLYTTNLALMGARNAPG